MGVGEGVGVSVGVGVGIEVCVVVGDATGAGGEPAGGVSSDSELHPHINKAKAPTAATTPNLEGIPTAHSPLPPSARTGSRSFINIEYAKRQIICLSIENVQQVSVVVRVSFQDPLRIEPPQRRTPSPDRVGLRPFNAGWPVLPIPVGQPFGVRWEPPKPIGQLGLGEQKHRHPTF